MAQVSLGEALNTNLKDAMAAAKMTKGQLARAVGVAPKTVDRWLLESTRVPHAETRHDVGAALGVDEGVLWPSAVRGIVKTGADAEIVTTYAYRNAAPTSLWGSLLDGARHRVVFAGYTNYFLWQQHPRLGERLAGKVASGCDVRFLLGDPDSEITRHREAVEDVPLTVSTRIRITLDALSRVPGHGGIDARYSDEHVSLSVFIFDGQMLVTPHLSNLLGHDSPMLHIRRLGSDGLYDRFASHVDALWATGRQVWAD